jgi:hypothetical protein
MVDKRFQPPLSDRRVKQDPCGNHPNWAMMSERTRAPRYADIIIIIMNKCHSEELTIWLREGRL